MLSKPTPLPAMARRAPSSRALANKAKMLRAISRIATDHGLDQLSIGQVAKRAGLTTGAIYGRYEDRDELAIELWQSVVKEPFRARLERSVELIFSKRRGDNPNISVSSKPAEFQALITSDFESPDEIAKLGAEFLVVARRDLAIGEVVVPEVAQWFADFGLVKSQSAIDKAAIVIALSASIGTALRAIIFKSNSNWIAIAEGLRMACAEATSIARPKDLEPPHWHDPQTDNPVRTALIYAVAEVVAKSGYANATISRIVRRAGLTNGSLYNLYADKEALTDDAMEIFLNLSSDVNRDSNIRAAEHLQTDRGLTDSFDLAFMPHRRSWLDFRLECLIASRDHAPTRKKFKQSLERSRDSLAATMPDLPQTTINLLSSGEQAVGIGLTTLAPYTTLLQESDYFSIMAKLSEQNRLFFSK
jgi:AcrR family transcriptional regulator